MTAAIATAPHIPDDVSEVALSDVSETDRMLFTVLSNAERVDLDATGRGRQNACAARIEELGTVPEEGAPMPPSETLPEAPTSRDAPERAHAEADPSFGAALHEHHASVAHDGVGGGGEEASRPRDLASEWHVAPDRPSSGDAPFSHAHGAGHRSCEQSWSAGVDEGVDPSLHPYGAFGGAASPARASVPLSPLASPGPYASTRRSSSFAECGDAYGGGRAEGGRADPTESASAPAEPPWHALPSEERQEGRQEARRDDHAAEPAHAPCDSEGGGEKPSRGGAAEGAYDAAVASWRQPVEDEDDAKRAVLLDLMQLEQVGGVRMTKQWTMADRLDDMMLELRRHTLAREEANSVNMMRDGLKLAITGIEMINTRLGILDLEGWSTEACRELSKQDANLARIYRKWWRRPTASSAEVDVGMAIIGSMAMHHMKRTMSKQMLGRGRAPASRERSSGAREPEGGLASFANAFRKGGLGGGRKGAASRSGPRKPPPAHAYSPSSSEDEGLPP